MDRERCSPALGPYSQSVLAGIFQGYNLRYRRIITSRRAHLGALGMVTLEYILRGYPYKLILGAWRVTPWSEEKREMITG